MIIYIYQISDHLLKRNEVQLTSYQNNPKKQTILACWYKWLILIINLLDVFHVQHTVKGSIRVMLFLFSQQSYKVDTIVSSVLYNILVTQKIYNICDYIHLHSFSNYLQIHLHIPSLSTLFYFLNFNKLLSPFCGACILLGVGPCLGAMFTY